MTNAISVSISSGLVDSGLGRGARFLIIFKERLLRLMSGIIHFQAEIAAEGKGVWKLISNEIDLLQFIQGNQGGGWF